MTVGILNYGSGNFGSVWNAFDYLGFSLAEVKRSSEVASATHLVLPGVGSFEGCMRRLREQQLVEALVERIGEGIPFLGICVGMQVLASRGEEFGTHEGLGLIGGYVRKLDSPGLRLPHIGWNSVDIPQGSRLTGALSEEPTFYFLHSYNFVVDDQALVATSDYGEHVTAIVEKENVFGVQFHPEKSQHDGLAVLDSFAKL